MDGVILSLVIIAIPIVILVYLLLVNLIFSFYELVILNPREFLKKKGIIISVNGIKDNDTGLLLGGCVNQTNLLFKDGEVIIINKNINSIRLNRFCKLYFTKTKYSKEESFSRIVYVKNIKREQET